MHLYDLPLVFALIGLALYTVLGGADFGAGIWQLTAGRGPDAERIREHAHRSMAPVWEANHVWLIFALTVFWTAYPTAFGSIASTLSVPLFLAAIGIILRGAAYALRSGAGSARELSRIDVLFAIASLLTPFALGAAAEAGEESERPERLLSFGQRRDQRLGGRWRLDPRPLVADHRDFQPRAGVDEQLLVVDRAAHDDPHRI